MDIQTPYNNTFSTRYTAPLLGMILSTLIFIQMASMAHADPLPQSSSQKSGIVAAPSTSSTTTMSNHHEQPALNYVSVWADASGATHIKHCKIENEQFKSYAPPAAPQWIGTSPDQIQGISYAALPVGYVGTWHHAPGPQWVVTLSGEWSVETTDGHVVVQGPGEMQFNDDSSSHPRGNDRRVGHISKTVGTIPNEQLIIKLKPGAHIHQIDHCVY